MTTPYVPRKPKTQAIHDALVMTLRQLDAPVTLTELARLAIGQRIFPPYPGQTHRTENHSREAYGGDIQGIARAMERAGQLRHVGPGPWGALYVAGPNLPESVDVEALEGLVSTPVDPPDPKE